jgi:SRSO17 transposase
VAALPILDLDAWRAGFDDLFARFAGRFVQVQTRRRARAYVLGLLSRTERKNGWTLAEQAGDDTPDDMQRLLGHAAWDVDAVRDDLRGYVVDQLGHEQAVAGLTVPYSNGPTEGVNTKIKLLKRQTYGKASFRLLRKRILLAD